MKTNKNPRTETPEELALPQLHFLSFSRPSKKLQEQFSPLVSPMGKLRPREAKGLLQGCPPPPVVLRHSPARRSPGPLTQVLRLILSSCWSWARKDRAWACSLLRPGLAKALGGTLGAHSTEGCQPGRAGPDRWVPWHRAGQRWGNVERNPSGGALNLRASLKESGLALMETSQRAKCSRTPPPHGFHGDGAG